MGAALALTVVNWGTQIASYHLTAIAAHFPISLAGSITAMLLVNVGFLVRATPGNMGVFQLVYAVTAQALGLSSDAAVGAGAAAAGGAERAGDGVGRRVSTGPMLAARKRKAAPARVEQPGD